MLETKVTLLSKTAHKITLVWLKEEAIIYLTLGDNFMTY